MTDNNPTPQNYLHALRELIDAQEALAMGLLTDEQYEAILKKTDAIGAEWDLYCQDQDKRNN